MNFCFFVKPLFLLVFLIFVHQAGYAQYVYKDGALERKVYKKVSGDSLRLRSNAKAIGIKSVDSSAKHVAKPKKVKVDSLQYSPRQYLLGERVIMRGDSGRDVRSLANMLVKKLYMDEGDIVYTADDGVLYDGELFKAVIRFQRLNGFYEDGIVGRELIKALRKRTESDK